MTSHEHGIRVVDDSELPPEIEAAFFPVGAPFGEVDAPDCSSDDSSSHQQISDAEDSAEDWSDFESYDGLASDLLSLECSQPSTVQDPVPIAKSGEAMLKKQILDVLDSCQLPEEQKKKFFAQFYLKVLLGS